MDFDAKKMGTLELHERDEFWSVGPDIHSYYRNILKDLDPDVCDKQREILLEPCTTTFSRNETCLNNHVSRRPFLSVWDTSYCMSHFWGKNKIYTRSFQRFGTALRKINDEQGKEKRINWVVHGMTEIERSSFLKNELSIGDSDLLTATTIPNSQDLPWNNYSAIIFPLVQENEFNFLAMNAIWLGIPTLVSCESNVGKLLSSLPCPENSRTAMNLIGNSSVDVETWRSKILNEILNENARPTEWAKRLSECLQNTLKMRENHLAVLHAYLECR